MTDLRKAAEMALDYIEQALQLHDQQYQRHPSTEHDRQVIVDDLRALRQALAQPEQEQYVTKVVAMHEDGTYTTERIPLPKREWVGLTDEERFLNDCRSPEEIEYAIAIEAKLKERNT